MVVLVALLISPLSLLSAESRQAVDQKFSGNPLSILEQLEKRHPEEQATIFKLHIFLHNLEKNSQFTATSCSDKQKALSVIKKLEDNHPEELPILFTHLRTFVTEDKNGYINLETCQELKKFDQNFDFCNLCWLQSDDALKFYTALYGSKEFMDAVTEKLLKWSSSFVDTTFKKKLSQAWLKATTNVQPKSNLDKIIRKLYQTRADRWARLAKSLGMSMPKGFRAYRGIKGSMDPKCCRDAYNALAQIVKAWKESGKSMMRMPQHEVASWSLSKKKGEFFSDINDPCRGGINIFFDADIPFENTLADLWVDGYSFPCVDEKEVIVGWIKGGLEVPKERIKVAYKGIIYTYASRQELIKQWTIDQAAAKD